jgi:hypothetical protein
MWYCVFLFRFFFAISCAIFIRVCMSCTYSFTSGASSIYVGLSIPGVRIPYCQLVICSETIIPFLKTYGSLWVNSIVQLPAFSRSIRVCMSCTYSFTSGASSIYVGLSIATCNGNGIYSPKYYLWTAPFMIIALYLKFCYFLRIKYNAFHFSQV